MSGKRQHFIPRFLLQGFTSRYSGKQYFACVHRKGSPAVETNINNIGVETYFYFNGEDNEADNRITDAEGVFSELVHVLRETQPGPVTDPLIAELLAHLNVRTRHFREGFLRAGCVIVERILSLLGDESKGLSHLERELRKNPSILTEALADKLDSRSLPRAQAEPVVRALMPYLRILLDQMKPEISAMVKHLQSVLPATLREGARSGHVSALKEELVPQARVDLHRHLRYMVASVPEEDMVLGDSVVVYRIEGPRRYKPFIDKGDVVTSVYLPLSATKVLLGSTAWSAEPPAALPLEIARCSLEFFISAETSRDRTALVTQIGENAAHLTKAELDEIADEIDST